MNYELSIMNYELKRLTSQKVKTVVYLPKVILLC